MIDAKTREACVRLCSKSTLGSCQAVLWSEELRRSCRRVLLAPAERQTGRESADSQGILGLSDIQRVESILEVLSRLDPADKVGVDVMRDLLAVLQEDSDDG